MAQPSFPRLAIAFVRTILAVVFVSVYTCLVGPPGMVLAVLFKWPNVLYKLGSGGVLGMLWLTGIRYVVEGGEHILLGRAAVYTVNHASNVEPPLLYLALRRLFPRLQILYKAEIHKIPVLSWGFDIVGFVPIQRKNREQSAQALDQAVRQIRAGNSFLVFPEGTRSRTGELLPFKKGAFKMAIAAQAPIVPVAIDGSREAMRKGSPVIWPVTVRIRFGPAVETAGRGQDDREAVLAEVRSRIGAQLDAIRTTTVPRTDAPHSGASAAGG